MVASKRGGNKPKSLAHGRPPTLRKPIPSLSAKATRTLIRSHHQLQKAHAQAVKVGDETKAKEIERQIKKQGGLEKYQIASITGQSSERGGDSSRLLVQWLEELAPSLAGNNKITREGRSYRMLEVGALSTKNACSHKSYLSVERIDLHSQEPGITQQDFMQRPSPKNETEKFEVLSLSLVLNYVPDAEGRGEMLKRTRDFLHYAGTDPEDKLSRQLPCLFLVLPAPCVTNSRYLDDDRLGHMMRSLGYELSRQKETAKLVYYLWKLIGTDKRLKAQTFPKVEVNPGAKRNNFCIVMR
ncbi:hypothetical protein K490DRAFT_56720 [Saccharata proteae CBS 121410]|uniref:25S rRNA adenine-N(1) methyltransferase n=1 Tax=Saccharata proteae CBS 121410 TaxID=1314787 RepID=A0A9P4HXE4_9PEZI|nr:hypothetical protein K490DRAFT_56720 [Saccharata proteae CBS 121410]